MQQWPRRRGKPLSDEMRSFFEPRFGTGFDDVRVHTGGAADKMARSVNAEAFTTGSDIVFRSGAYEPETGQGKRLLAHELAHVVQNREPAGRTRTGELQRQSDESETGTETDGGGGPNCDCPETEPYKQVALDQVSSMAPLIKGAASSSSAPESVVAAVIADEYGAQQRYYGILDATQNVIIGSLPESFIEVDQYFDIKYKLLNALENDIGPANFKVRTALELVREQQHGTTESEPEDIDVSHIVDQLLTETGTVQATVLMIEKAHSLFGPYVKSYPKPWADAVYVSYFKQGSSYYQRFQEAHDFDPSHQPCPGTAGCRYEQHHDQIEQALSSK